MDFPSNPFDPGIKKEPRVWKYHFHVYAERSWTFPSRLEELSIANERQGVLVSAHN